MFVLSDNTSDADKSIQNYVPVSILFALKKFIVNDNGFDYLLHRVKASFNAYITY